MFAWLDRFRPLAVLIARVVLGAIMLVHGWHKIFPRGSLYNFAQSVAHMGLPYWLGYVAAFTEFFGGALLILGLLVPIAGSRGRPRQGRPQSPPAPRAHRTSGI